MLFNSYEFIFGFLPATVLVFLLLSRFSRAYALGWLILASLIFYAWWRPLNLAIIGPSIAINYACARALLRLAVDENRSRTKTIVLTFGVAFNLLLLGYFKYANFGVHVINDVAGTDFVVGRIILPLGISFITFQKIAFLVDVAGGRIKAFTAKEFLLFVLFFPQLIAGPIVHFQETIPQFRKRSDLTPILFAAGLTLFCFGLAKKVLLADGMALHVSPIYQRAAEGEPVSLIQSWVASVGFTLQIYFDFSGYSDMACGSALMFGVRLPLNFNSPLKAGNIIEFWQRWHISLTSFLTSYVYNPLSLWVLRRRARKRLPPLKQSNAAFGAFFNGVAWPILLTMFLSGLWHGAGYTFLVWGLLHGLYLLFNHAWRQYGAKRFGATGAATTKIAALTGWFATFFGVAVAMIFFRAPDVGTATSILGSMTGGHGLGLPNDLVRRLGLSASVFGGAGKGVDLRELALSSGYVIALLFIALAAPNTAQMLAKQQPVLGGPTAPPKFFGIGPRIYWSPNVIWLAIAIVVGSAAVLKLAGVSEFLYWQF